MNKNSKILYQNALFLEYFTVGYNIIEAVLSIFFGNAASSIALISFGLDSVVESLSGSVLIWRLRAHGSIPKQEEELIEEKAKKFVSITFLILGMYVIFESFNKLVNKDISQPSLIGMIIAVFSIIIMPILAWRKRIVGNQIGSKALIEDSKETITCAFLSIALLIGLGANYFFGFWQADPIIGIIIAIFLFWEAYESWNELKMIRTP
ncbi:MAG TPA: cation transporter [Methanoregulaceae archaeon]|nr:cation transporter [Methanoregulaceae archaeon]